MANAYAINFEPDRQNLNNAWSSLWKLTRVMKAAGWAYKAASAGTVASTTVASGSNTVPLPVGTIHLTSTAGFPTTGGSVLIGTLNTIVFFTGVSGNDITGCTGGTGTLATGQTVTVRGDSSGIAANDPWGGSVNPLNDTFPSTVIAPLSDGVAASTGTINVVSTAGFPNSGVFNINNISTNVTYTGKTATSFTGCTGGSGTMHIGYGVTLMDVTAAWWVGEGPSTVKIGINTPSTGTFLRGEVVFQANSGAVGELLGYVINAAGTNGWMVVMPQTGTFDGYHQVTGAITGATIVPDGYYNLIRRQVVFAKNTTTTNGWIFYEALSDTEIANSSNTALFSDLAANAVNCTTAVAPGNSSSGSNRFPLYGISCIGTAEGTGQPIFGNNTYFGKAHITATNVTPSLGVTADGTFFCAQWDAEQITPTFGYKVIGLMRLDQTEPGDVDPFVFLCGATGEAIYTNAGRTAGSTLDSSVGWVSGTWGSNQQFGSAVPAKGYCARTTGTIGIGIDQYCGFNFGVVTHAPASVFTAAVVNQFSASKIRNHPDSATPNANPPPIFMEPFSVIGVTTGLTMRKGICRWYGIASLGMYNDTFDSKKWLSIMMFGGSSSATPSIIIGPLDGVTPTVES